METVVPVDAAATAEWAVAAVMPDFSIRQELAELAVPVEWAVTAAPADCAESLMK